MIKIVVKNIVKIDSKTEGDLRHIINMSEEASTFHDFDLYKIVARELSDSIYVNIAYKDSKPEGLVFYDESKKFIFKYQYSPPSKSLIAYGGPISINNDLDIIKRLLEKMSGFNRYNYLISYPKVNLIPFADMRFKIREGKTLYIDISGDENTIWLNMENRIRRNIKKAYKEKITIIHDNGELFEDFYKIYASLCERTGLFLHEKTYYKKLNDLLSTKKNNRFFYGIKDGKVISAMNILIKGDIIHPWFGGTLSEYMKTGVGSLVYWEIMKYGQSINCKTFDFLGLDVGPIAFYKKGFGGQEVPFYTISNRGWPLQIGKKLIDLLNI